MASCDACGLETDVLYLQPNNTVFCQHCAPTRGILPTPAVRQASVIRTQVWSFTPKHGLQQHTLPEPQRTLTIDGELLPHWFLCPAGERNSLALLYAREKPSQALMREVVAEADVRFAGESWMR